MIFEEVIKYRSLLEINGVKFTPREIDIISCVISGKTPQAIANFLSTPSRPIELRTVNTHIANIRRKIEGGARGSIIEFIEKSDKLQVARNYYLDLLMKNEFYGYQKELRLVVQKNIEEITIILYQKEGIETRQNSHEENDFAKKMNLLADRLQNDFRLLGAAVSIQNSYIFTSIYEAQSCSQDKHYIITIPPFMQKGASDAAFGGSNFAYKRIDSNLFLLYQSGHYFQDRRLSTTIDYIDLEKEQNYYLFFINIIKKLIKNEEKELLSIESKLVKKYHGIYDNSNSAGISNEFLQEKLGKNFYLSILKNPLKTSMIACLIVLPIIWLFLGIISVDMSVNETVKSNSSLRADSHKELSARYDEFSTGNLTQEKLEKNFNIIKNFSHSIAEIESGKIYKNFDINKLQTKDLINAIYNLNCISAYSLFKEHNALKAQKILKFARFLAESCISQRSNNVRIDFDRLSHEEIYTELAIIKDLPELYCISVYFTARSYIYQRKSELAEKYFELSRYLASKFDLFEGFLSASNGVAIIKADRADLLIKNGDYQKARANIFEAIEIYKSYANDDKSYILNFRPDKQTIEYKTPKNDIIYLVDSNKRLVNLYTKLLFISDSIEEGLQYLDQVEKQYIPGGHSKYSLKILKDSNEVLPRFKADTYNKIGEFLLVLNDKKIDFSNFKEKIAKVLGLDNEDNIQFIFQLFNLAKQISRSTEFTKADSLRGLAEIYKRKMNMPDIPAEEKKALRTEIHKLTKAADLIYQALNKS